MVPAEGWDKVRELALRQLDRFVSLETKVLAGDDPEAIHDMRVASRRLQQILDLLYSAPRPDEVRRLRRKIRRARRAFGEVRNSDVLLERVRKVLRRKRAARREAWARVERYLAERRTRSLGKAVQKLSRINLAVLYVRLKPWLTPPEAAIPANDSGTPPAAGESNGDPSFRDRVVQDLGKFWQVLETQVAESHRDPRPSIFHAVRITSKRLRYLTEVIHAFGVAGSADAVAWLRSLQQHLGDWHDFEVLERTLVEMVARPDFLREELELAMEVERLILKNRAVKQRYTGRYFEMTRDSRDFERVKEWVTFQLASPPAALASG